MAEPKGPGQRPRYCGRGCRRAAEQEIRRVLARIEKHEAEIEKAERELAGIGAYQPPHVVERRRTWHDEQRHLNEERLRALYDAQEDDGA